MNYKNIISKYPTLNPEVLVYPKAKEYYAVSNISQFNHFLTNQEATEQVVFYNDRLNDEKYQALEHRFLKAFSKLFELYELWDYQYIDSDHSEVWVIKDKDVFLKKIIKGLREIENYSFLIPKLSLIVFTDFDLEIAIYSANVHDAKVLYDDCFKDVGLYLL